MDGMIIILYFAFKLIFFFFIVGVVLFLLLPVCVVAVDVDDVIIAYFVQMDLDAEMDHVRIDMCLAGVW